MYTPLFFGADKTTVSVATGDVEFHPGYLSLGNIYNTMRRGHRNGVVPFIFFAIPKSIPPSPMSYRSDHSQVIENMTMTPSFESSKNSCITHLWLPFCRP